jgi:DNA-binding NarL/FixJ family response regulator
MTPSLLRDCATCPHKERPIFIVGNHKFSTELVAEYIDAKTPAKWAVFESLREVPPPENAHDTEWRLIFVDCLGLKCTDLPKIIQAEAAHLLNHDLFALFNLERDCNVLMHLFNLGIRGFFFTDDRKEMLLKGICALKYGEMWVPREVMMQYINMYAHSPPTEPAENGELTRRERQVLCMIAGGASNQEIAAEIFVSPHTVKTHIYNIFKKIGVKTRVQAALWAAKHLQ